MMERLHNKKMFYIGPQIPYVIPYLLDMDSMIAVITEHAFPCGDTFYTTVYFTENPPPRYKLCDPWDRRPDGYYQEYNVGYDPRMHWDFDLMPWVEAGKVRWCTNIDGQLSLQEASANVFPFAARLGYPCRQFVTGPGTRTHKSYKVAADLNGGDYYPPKYHLSKFLTDNLPRDGEGNFIKPHFEIPFEENGDS